MKNQHHRVLPRDLLNESKLLKCWARVALLAHDGRIGQWSVRYTEDSEEGDPFDIRQNGRDGTLFIDNLVFVHSGTGREVALFSEYNDRGPWPLSFETTEDDDVGFDEGPVFENDGSLTDAFLKALDQ